MSTQPVAMEQLRKAHKRVMELTDKMNFPDDGNSYPWRTGVGIGAGGIHLYVRELTEEIKAAIPTSIDVDGVTVPILLDETGVIRAL